MVADDGEAAPGTLRLPPGTDVRSTLSTFLTQTLGSLPTTPGLALTVGSLPLSVQAMVGERVAQGRTRLVGALVAIVEERQQAAGGGNCAPVVITEEDVLRTLRSLTSIRR